MDLFDPFDKDWLKNRFKIYDQLRVMDLAYFSETHNMYVFTRHKDVVQILSNPAIFISGQGNLIKDEPRRWNRTPGASDGKYHTYYRKVVKDAYSKSRFDAINAAISYKTKQLLGNVSKDPIDMAHVARVVSAYMSAEVVNLPGVDKEYLTDLIVGIQLHSDRCVLHNQDNTEYDEFVKIIRDMVAKKVPWEGEGIYQEFMEKAKDPRTPISLFTGPVISGCYSMISAIEFMVFNLRNENVLDELLNDRSLISAAVSEELRFMATTGKFARTVTEPITVHGIDLKPGDKVAVCLDAAMRDPEVFPDPHTFNLHRNFSKSYPFGYGTHACAGQAIAKEGLEHFLGLFLDLVGKYDLITKEEDLDYIITASGNNDVIKEMWIKRV